MDKPPAVPTAAPIRRFRPLRRTVLTIVVLTTVTVSIVLLAVLRWGLLRVFASIERGEAVERIRQVENAFENELDSLHALNGDWAYWKDTYDFVAGDNPDYVADNINPETFAGMGLDQMYIFDLSGNLVYATTIENVDGEATAQPAVLGETFKAAGLVADAPGLPPQAAVFAVGADLFLVSSRMITTGTKSNETNGTMLMARRIDQGRLTKLRQRVRLEFLAAAIAPSPDGVRICSVAPGDVMVETIDRDTLVGRSCLFGLSGQPQATLGISMPRDISALGRQSSTYSAIAIVLVLAVLSAVIVIFLNRRVTVRLERLVKELRANRLAEIAGGVSVGGNDEIALLEIETNATLTALAKEIDKARAAQENKRKQANALRDSEAVLKEKLRELEGFQSLTVDREIKMIELKKRISELEQKDKPV